MAIKRSCYLCSNTYEFCDCNRQPAYMATFCSENCRDIFKTLCSYGTDVISAEECKELLDCCDLSNKNSYKDSIRNTIEKLYATPIKEPEVIAEPVIEEIVPLVERKIKKRNHEVVLKDTE